MAKKYREDFLTKTRYTTRDINKAEKSFFQYGELDDGTFGLSILGIINGILPKIGLVMVSVLDEERDIKKYKIIRRFW